MQPRITVLTLGVDDLERALAFYRDGLGFATEGIVGREFEHGAVVCFDMQPGCGSRSGGAPACSTTTDPDGHPWEIVHLPG